MNSTQNQIYLSVIDEERSVFQTDRAKDLLTWKKGGLRSNMEYVGRVNQEAGNMLQHTSHSEPGWQPE